MTINFLKGGAAAALAFLLVSAATGPANARDYTEIGDAGQLLPTAQITYGGGATVIDGIFGTLSGASDVDLFQIFLPGGGLFSATTVETFDPSSGVFQPLYDSALFLFNASGFGVYANDDDPLASPRPDSTLPALDPLTPLTAGLYYLAITASPRVPTSAGGLRIFPDLSTSLTYQYTDVVGPTGPGGGASLSGWTETHVETGVVYRIALTGTQFAVIPEPGTLLLIAVGTLVPLAHTRRRQRP